MDEVDRVETLTGAGGAVGELEDAVDDGAGVTGLMLSIVSISICLKLQLLIVCIGSLADILASMISRGSLRAWIWLSAGGLCENQPAITGLH